MGWGVILDINLATNIKSRAGLQLHYRIGVRRLYWHTDSCTCTTQTHCIWTRKPTGCFCKLKKNPHTGREQQHTKRSKQARDSYLGNSIKQSRSSAHSTGNNAVFMDNGPLLSLFEGLMGEIFQTPENAVILCHAGESLYF